MVMGAYLPKKILVLYDSNPESLNSLLGGIEVPIESIDMTRRDFELPDLFVDGDPQYSHVVIYGSRSQLTKTDLEKLAKFADGSDDPMYSRLSHHERETLPNLTTYQNNATTKNFKRFFDPYPGASLMIISQNETMRILLSKIGAKITDKVVPEGLEVVESPILANLKEYKQSLA